MFGLRELNEVDDKEKYCVEVSNRFASLDDLYTEVGINSAKEMIRRNIRMFAKDSLGYYELKTHKPWFDKRCSELLDQRKQAKLQWLHDPIEINGYNLNNVRREAIRHFRDKRKKKYLRDKINKLAMNGKDENIRDLYRVIKEFKKDYQPK
jgi:hypothetical protein